MINIVILSGKLSHSVDQNTDTVCHIMLQMYKFSKYLARVIQCQWLVDRIQHQQSCSKYKNNIHYQQLNTFLTSSILTYNTIGISTYINYYFPQ